MREVGLGLHGQIWLIQKKNCKLKYILRNRPIERQCKIITLQFIGNGCTCKPMHSRVGQTTLTISQPGCSLPLGRVALVFFL